MMPLIYVETDELYPYYFVLPYEDDDPSWRKKWVVDIPQETLDRWERVREEFFAMQEEMEKYE